MSDAWVMHAEFLACIESMRWRCQRHAKVVVGMIYVILDINSAIGKGFDNILINVACFWQRLYFCCTFIILILP